MKDVDSDRIDDRFDADIQAGADDNGDGILDASVFADLNNNQIPDFLDKSAKATQPPKSTKSIKSAKPTKPTMHDEHKESIQLSKIAANDKPAKLIETKPKQSRKAIQVSDDSDGDGLSNGVELALGLNPTLSDSDGDGLNDALEVGVNPKSPQDSDRDGAIDAMDKDDDNDGILTKHEIQVSNKLSYRLDTDNDGVFNYQDANDDGDSRLTKVEGHRADSDKDGIPDYLDSNDGVSKASTAKVVVLYDKSVRTDQKPGADSNLKSDPALAVVTKK